MDEFHRTVMLSEVLDYLEIKKDEWYLDGTMGDGGHSLGILQAGGRVIGIDQDPEALDRAKARLERAGFNEGTDFRFFLGNFRNLDQLVPENVVLNGVVLDLGVSTLQLKSSERGFSFALTGKLDMRMDPSLGVTAADLVNVLNKGELYELFKNYGEERFARRIAEAVVGARPITQTTELAQIIEKNTPRGKPGDIHPATQVFQALRIAVNDELGSLKEALPKVLTRLNNKGRLVIITFHSLEDRIVKNTFKDFESRNLGAIITPKPIDVSPEEVRENIRSRSAKIRVFEKNA
jgi:16S rRNA (cytosine1402-N4)-methyltransferase